MLLILIFNPHTVIYKILLYRIIVQCMEIVIIIKMFKLNSLLQQFKIHKANGNLLPSGVAITSLQNAYKLLS